MNLLVPNKIADSLKKNRLSGYTILKTNAIECTACKAWVHKRCSRVRGALTRVKDYECGRCKGLHNDEEEVKCMDMIEVVQEFCCLGDIIVGGGGDVWGSVKCVLTGMCVGWQNYGELSQVLCGRVLSLKLRGRLYRSCVGGE